MSMALCIQPSEWKAGKLDASKDQLICWTINDEDYTDHFYRHECATDEETPKGIYYRVTTQGECLTFETYDDAMMAVMMTSNIQAVFTSDERLMDLVVTEANEVKPCAEEDADEQTKLC
jgi:hypothetical protein